MAANKTVETGASVREFVDRIDDPRKRREVRKIMQLMRAATGRRAKMWGASIIGFGRYEYTYASGRSGSMCLTGLSPRSREITVYIMPGFGDYGPLLERLGPHRLGKSCLYLKSLEGVDLDVLGALIERSVEAMRRRYQTG